MFHQRYCYCFNLATVTTTVVSTSTVRPSSSVTTTAMKFTSLTVKSATPLKSSNSPTVMSNTEPSHSSLVSTTASSSTPLSTAIPNKSDDSSDEKNVGVLIGGIIGGLVFLVIAVSVASVIAWHCGKKAARPKAYKVMMNVDEGDVHIDSDEGPLYSDQNDDDDMPLDINS